MTGSAPRLSGAARAVEVARSSAPARTSMRITTVALLQRRRRATGSAVPRRGRERAGQPVAELPKDRLWLTGSFVDELLVLPGRALGAACHRRVLRPGHSGLEGVAQMIELNDIR